MQSNQDLNSNLIKSLTSVHLPPPPSSHAQQQYPHINNYPQNNQIYFPQHSNNQYSNHHYHLPQAQNPNGLISNDIQLQPEVSIAPGTYQYQEVPDDAISVKSSKRKTESSDELSLPLTTPPHTVSRHESRPIKKSKVQETPTLNQTRMKKTVKNPLSPQYSSPSANNSTESIVISKKVSKPPQPSFTTPKTKGSSQKKQADPQQFEELPSPSLMPKIIHESDAKPPYSYATLIGMAILRGEDRKLTLSQIYSWISTTFKYYRKNDVGWQNSIRHNLSLNKAFIKTEKSSDGKGHYWEVVKGFEMQFIRGKSGKRSFVGVPLEGSKPSSATAANEQVHDTKPSLQETSIAPKNEAPRIEIETIDNLSSDSDFSDAEDDNSKTPKSQIRSTDDALELNRPSLRKSNTAIGLQRDYLRKSDNSKIYSDEEEFTDEDEINTKIPTKKINSRSIPAKLSDSLTHIPSLQAPESTWAASASGEHIIFGQLKHSGFGESPQRASRVTSLPVTSSFSCNTNFELSPSRPSETGPLLEPLTPSSRLSSFTTTTAATSYSSSQQQCLPSITSTNLASLTKTPLRAASSNHQNISGALLNSSQTNHFLNFIKTPNSRIRTPNSNSIMKKFWNSPSFIDDFYTSPSVPRNSDDDYHKGLFGSPDRRPHERKSAFLENSGSYGFSDFFGVDICSVVKRATENFKDDQASHKHSHNLSNVEPNSPSTDEEDLEGNKTV